MFAIRLQTSGREMGQSERRQLSRIVRVRGWGEKSVKWQSSGIEAPVRSGSVVALRDPIWKQEQAV